jgi:hypothetical protein
MRLRATANKYAFTSQSPAAARAAIALHQALPSLERPDYYALWAISKGN